MWDNKSTAQGNQAAAEEMKKMWTRSAKNKTTGLMTVVCTDWNGEEFFRGEFADVAEANKAGEDAERRMTNAMNVADDEIPADIASMSAEELLAELMA